jgi:hypothetical protein
VPTSLVALSGLGGQTDAQGSLVHPSARTPLEIPTFAWTCTDKRPLEQPSKLGAIEILNGRLDHAFVQVNRGAMRHAITIRDDKGPKWTINSLKFSLKQRR